LIILKRESLLEDIRELFQPAPSQSRMIGAELEMIPSIRKTGERVLAQEGRPCSADFLRKFAGESGWTEERMGQDPSCWTSPAGRITFEPGGQIELSSSVYPSANELLQSMEKWIALLQEHAQAEGVELKTLGIEDRVPIERVPPQLHRDRYVKMTHYFESIGPYGVLMMRQTASLQINVDRGPRPAERWRLLNALVPFLVAIFANSPRYAGMETNHKTYRANVWRLLDPQRTGVRYDPADPAECYLQFALDAPMILGNESNHFPTFRQVLDDRRADKEKWETHLSTLFPEIRPRNYFEIRSIDAISPEHLPAPIAFIVGLVYDDASANAALELLGDPDPELLALAGARGLSNSLLTQRAGALAHLALEGCRSLGNSYISTAYMTRAEQFFNEYTLAARSPADQ